MTRTGVSMEAKLLAVFSSGVPLKVTALCQGLGISRQTLYKYRRRLAVEGPPGLVERSRRPHTSPTQVPLEIEDAIVRLRKELRIDCGAQAIAYHLARQGHPAPSVATIHRILVRRGMVTPQPSKRPKSAWRRFEWPRPNDAWQIDATCWALADGQTVWIMDVLDDHSRARRSTARAPTNAGPPPPPATPGDAIAGPVRASIHSVHKAGHIGWSDYVVGIDSRLAGQRVLVIARDFNLAIYGQSGLLRRLTIDTNRRYQGTGIPPGRRH